MQLRRTSDQASESFRGRAQKQRKMVATGIVSLGMLLLPGNVRSQEAVVPRVNLSDVSLIIRPDRYLPLTEPPCSYCSTQHLKGLIRDNDRVIAWLRGAHNGGAFPIRHFLANSRVVNDTYGLFFFDPDGGYVAAFEKDEGYRFHGWRNGVMVVADKNGTLWSALSGRAFDGPQRGKRLQRIPSMVTQWQYWLMLHPESTAYDLFDGKKYPVTELPTELTDEVKPSIPEVIENHKPLELVIGVERLSDSGEVQATKAYPLPVDQQRACINDTLDDLPLVVFWYRPTESSVVFDRRVGEQTLTFYADDISPETAPIKDRETGTRWTLAGRAVDGPLRGTELRWVHSIQCRWYAWRAEYPDTLLFRAKDAP